MRWSEYLVQDVAKEDKNYPKALLALKRPPKRIYYRGELRGDIFKRSVAIVGSRRMTRYGASVVDRFVFDFATSGVTTISGYMYGIDTAVHEKTVEYGGKTVAVMGGGISSPYPTENDKLYTKILKNDGLVLSEYKPEVKPNLWMYPQRNRIIAALASFGVLVVEAGEKSGSLITVQYARKLKKKIYAVPGPVTSSVSEGTNYLIKKGLAEMVTGPEDILRVKERENERVKENAKLDEIEKKIFEILKNEEMSIDEIAMAVERDLVEVSTAVSMMALRGVVSEAGGKYFVV